MPASVAPFVGPLPSFWIHPIYHSTVTSARIPRHIRTYAHIAAPQPNVFGSTFLESLRYLLLSHSDHCGTVAIVVVLIWHGSLFLLTKMAERKLYYLFPSNACNSKISYRGRISPNIHRYNTISYWRIWHVLLLISFERQSRWLQ